MSFVRKTCVSRGTDRRSPGARSRHSQRRSFRALVVARTLAGIVALTCPLAGAQASIQLDRFAQATSGDPACPVQPPPLLSEQEARVEAHVRVERGLRCAMEGKCEPGGAYKRDPEINARVRDRIASDRRFADTSIWVTTSRKWITLQGCVRRSAQREALVDLVSKTPGVERVFDELKLALRRKGARATKATGGAAGPITITLALDTTGTPVVEYGAPTRSRAIRFADTRDTTYSLRRRFFALDGNCGTLQREAIELNDAGCRSVALRLTWDGATRDRVYPPMVKLENGGALVFTEYLQVAGNRRGATWEIRAPPGGIASFGGRKATDS